MANYTFKLIDSNEEQSSEFRGQFLRMAQQMDSGVGVDMDRNLYDFNIELIKDIPEFVKTHFGDSVTPLEQEPFINPDGGRQSTMITVQPALGS